MKLVGEQARLLTNTGACTERIIDEELPLRLAVTLEDSGVVNLAAVATKLAVDEPEETVTAAGTETALVLLLVSSTDAPPDGAFPFSVTVHVDEPPDVREVGEQASAAIPGPEFCVILALPGAGRLAATSSITSTQSFPSGAVKLCEPLFGNVPISVAAPV